jgi:hypothetical protein
MAAFQIMKHEEVIGDIDGYELRILCAHGIEGIPELAEATKKILRSLKKPY